MRIERNNTTKRQVLINNVRTLRWKNSLLVRIHISRIFDISARNSSPKPPELYSILNPDTSSLSPSAKSKGARFVSDTIVINHISRSGILSNPIGNLSDTLMEYPFPSSIIVNRKKIREISYEIVWALARKEPRKLYLLLELHPAKKIGNTLNPEMTRKTITLYLILTYLNSNCKIIQKLSANPNVRGAIIRKKILFLLKGTNISLVNNFTASAKGCNTPRNPTLLGPFRS